MQTATEPDDSDDFDTLQRRWRCATREWLAARNEVARLQDSAILDVATASAAVRRLEHAQRRRTALALRVEALLGPNSDSR